jgi:hypothetical protein
MNASIQSRPAAVTARRWVAALTAFLPALTLAGTLCALAVLVTRLAGQVAVLRALWVQTAVRVAGSWIAASGLLLLGWTLRGA